MSSEKAFYRENLEEILKYTGNRHLLSISDVKGFTGLKDYRTVRRYYPMSKEGYISAATLASCLSVSARDVRD